jgi:phytoene dehydrogenase-like protein
MKSATTRAAARCFVVFALSLSAWAAPEEALRVAVVGAGAAGLTAARTLTGLGHDVVVFEKENRVGGKVFSIPVGDKALEFGAVLVTEDDYPITLGYADEFDLPTVPAPAEFTILDESGNSIAISEFLSERYTAAEIAAAQANYAAVLHRFARFIEAPGLVSLPDDLSVPFAEFAKRFGIEVIEDWMKALLSGFGYSYSETVPAAYYVKFLPFLVNNGPSGLEGPSGRIFPGGFQSVFDALASTLDVRLNSTVTHVRRPPAWCKACKVRLTVNGIAAHSFDAVVIATPLNVVPRFLDVTPFERWLFTRMQSVRYVVTLFVGLGFDDPEVLFVLENAHPDRINHVGALAAPYDFGSLTLGNAYQVVDRDVTPRTVQEVLAEDMWAYGRRYLAALYQQEWTNYMPHVSPAFLELGFYDVVDRMQGHRATYFVGSSLTFESVEHAARQARGVVRQHFGR